MLAREIMNTEVITTTMSANLAEAAALMLEHGINALPVIDAEGRVRGMVGIRDVLRAPWSHTSGRPISRWDRLEEKALALTQTPVEDVMVWQVICVGPETNVIDAAALMANQGVHPIPVIAGDRLLGVISRADIARLLLDLARSLTRQNGEPGTYGREPALPLDREAGSA